MSHHYHFTFPNNNSHVSVILVWLVKPCLEYGVLYVVHFIYSIWDSHSAQCVLKLFVFELNGEFLNKFKKKTLAQIYESESPHQFGV